MLSAKSLSKTSDVWFARGNNEKRENNSLDETGSLSFVMKAACYINCILR